MITFIIILCLIWGWVACEMYFAPSDKHDKKLEEYESDEEAIF